MRNEPPNSRAPSPEWLLKLLLESLSEVNRSLGRLEALTNGNREIVTARIAALVSTLEIRLTQLQQQVAQIATSMHSVPRPIIPHQTSPTPTTPFSTATSSTGIATGMLSSKVQAVGHKFGTELLVWFLGKLWAMVYPLLLPGIAFIGALLWKYLAPLWKFMIG